MPEQSLRKHNFLVSPENSNQRLDIYLKEMLADLSRTNIKQIIENNLVKINNELVVKPHRKVKAGDSIEIEIPPKKELSVFAEEIDLDILYEDDDLMVVNKPAGLVVHPGEGNAGGTLVNALLHHTKDLSTVNSPQRPGIVHRLDKETSGVMVIAKNNPTHLALTKQFAQHSINRIYIALVEGHVEFNESDIDMPLSRSLKDRKKIAVNFIKGKVAKTYYRVLKRFKDRTLLELKPYTGRTHQLRVHLAHIGHPILGDEKYGKKKSFPRLALHAKTLGFIHPRTNKSIEFSQDPPEEFLKG